MACLAAIARHHPRIPSAMIRSPYLRRVAVLTSVAVLGAVAVACARADEAKGTDSGAAVVTPAAAAQPGAPATPVVAPTDSISTRADRGRIQGRESAPVWVVVISDFQCPYCRMWHDETYAALKKEYVDAGKIRMAYVNFPLPSHKHAWPAAEAVMCSSVQGKFWEVHSRIFETQKTWTPLADAAPMFDSLAVASGVDAARYRSCIATRATKALIQADLDRSMQAGINSTPTFIIGGEALSGALPIAEFRTAIDAALAKAGVPNTAPAR